MSVLGAERQNWISPIFAFATLVGPPAACDAYDKKGLTKKKSVVYVKKGMSPILALATLVGPPAACDAYDKKKKGFIKTC